MMCVSCEQQSFHHNRSKTKADKTLLDSYFRNTILSYY